MNLEPCGICGGMNVTIEVKPVWDDVQPEYRGEWLFRVCQDCKVKEWLFVRAPPPTVPTRWRAQKAHHVPSGTKTCLACGCHAEAFTDVRITDKEYHGETVWGCQGDDCAFMWYFTGPNKELMRYGCGNSPGRWRWCMPGALFIYDDEESVLPCINCNHYAVYRDHGDAHSLECEACGFQMIVRLPNKYDAKGTIEYRFIQRTKGRFTHPSQAKFLRDAHCLLVVNEVPVP